MKTQFVQLLLALLVINFARIRCDSNIISGSSFSLMPSETEDSGSIEMPVRKQRSGQSQHRPIVEFVLGVLDTFHSSAKSELKRIQARHARHNMVYDLPSTTESPTSKLYNTKPATPRKKSIAIKI